MVNWLLDETAHAGAEHLDPDFIAGYDRKQGHPDPGPEIKIFQAYGLDGSSTVVDLAAGTGQFALRAAAAFGRVVAVDVSPAMVAHLRGAVADRELSNVDVARAGFLSYEHAGAPADGVHSRHGLHQLPDFWKGMALHRMAAILRPGGVLRVRDLIYDFSPAEAPERFARWFAGASTDPAAGYTAQDYADHIRGEHSTYRFLFEPLLEAAGFDIVDVTYEAGLFGSYTCVKRPV
jgi:ubiquinone/menaquinone biosynthesis C-methylase UbiE